MSVTLTHRLAPGRPPGRALRAGSPGRRGSLSSSLGRRASTGDGNRPLLPCPRPGRRRPAPRWQLPLASRPTPPSSLVLRLPPDPGAQRHPKRAGGRGAPPAEAAWAEDVRHGARGPREGGGTWNPRPVAGSPGSKITEEQWGRGLPHIRGGVCPSGRGIAMGAATQLGPVAPHPLCVGLRGMGQRTSATDMLPIPPRTPPLLPQRRQRFSARPESRTSLRPTPPTPCRATQKCAMVGRG